MTIDFKKTIVTHVTRIIRDGLVAVMLSDDHRIETCEDIAELDPETWVSLFREANVTIATSARNQIIRLLKSIDGLPEYEYSSALGR